METEETEMKNHSIANVVNTLHWEDQGLSRETARGKEKRVWEEREGDDVF